MKYDLKKAPKGRYYVSEIEGKNLSHEVNDFITVSSFGESHLVCTNHRTLATTNQLYVKSGVTVSTYKVGE